jgi:hypothetical protein
MLRDKIRNKIQEHICKCEQEVLPEARIGIGEFAESMKVVVEKSGGRTSYNLFDFVTDKVVGNIEIFQTNSGDYEVTGVAASPNFGASMYEIAMMDVFPKGLMPDRTGNTTDEAYGVWSKFFKRDDIKKKENPEWSDFQTSTDKNFLSNIIYSKAPDSNFNSLEFYDANDEEKLSIAKKTSPFYLKMRKLRGYDGNND